MFQHRMQSGILIFKRYPGELTRAGEFWANQSTPLNFDDENNNKRLFH